MNSRFHWCAQQVERGRRLVIPAHHPLRIGAPRRGRELEVVHDVAEVRRKLDAVALLHRSRAGLGELAGDPADLQRRNAGAVCEHERHLEDHLELVANAVGREIGERLRAVARVQQESVAFGDACQRAAQGARLAREHERGKRAELGEGIGERGGVGPHGLLHRGEAPPARGLPFEIRE
jgi:hypothetical protein